MPQAISRKLFVTGALSALVSLFGTCAVQAAAPRTATPVHEASKQVEAFAAGAIPCDSDGVKEAVSLIYEQDDVASASAVALRCEALAATQARPFNRVIASRIKAMIAMRMRDMVALKRAGETLVTEAQVPEYVADGHLFIAFACVFGGNPRCAREHVDTAKTLFTQLHVDEALAQLQPLEQTLMRLEAQSEDGR
ncbi:MAG TPA: hypothetical protein VFW93_14450 [Aquabacterium sp.]|uniref:hypothetical protein n=1 Tax=Aquabacterium sp. TaxID=1872578 RepID=UPI002E30C6F6|nr:hypothetical protein [Aquabacterium sp.]HEX5357411.1 hypothetical protein [Aquabacterium sp.]